MQCWFRQNKYFNSPVVVLLLAFMLMPFMFEQLMCSAGAQELSDPLADKPSQDLLQGSLSASELTATATITDENRESLVLNIENKGRRALIFQTDKASVNSSAGNSQSPLAQEQLLSSPPKVNIPGDAITVVASFGTVGILPLAVDEIQARQAKPGPYYGRDADRRRLAGRRFNRRVIFPGETSNGYVYFPDKIPANSTISIPVLVHPEGVEIGKLEIIVQQRPLPVQK